MIVLIYLFYLYYYINKRVFIMKNPLHFFYQIIDLFVNILKSINTIDDIMVVSNKYNLTIVYFKLETLKMKYFILFETFIIIMKNHGLISTLNYIQRKNSLPLFDNEMLPFFGELILIVKNMNQNLSNTHKSIDELISLYDDEKRYDNLHIATCSALKMQKNLLDEMISDSIELPEEVLVGYPIDEKIGMLQGTLCFNEILQIYEEYCRMQKDYGEIRTKYLEVRNAIDVRKRFLLKCINTNISLNGIKTKAEMIFQKTSDLFSSCTRKSKTSFKDCRTLQQFKDILFPTDCMCPYCDILDIAEKFTTNQHSMSIIVLRICNSIPE